MTSTDSVSNWILGAQVGDPSAIRQLWQRYYTRLVSLAAQKLAGKCRGMLDEEDVALSVFDSFCRAAQLNRFPDLTDRDQLWRLLIRITAEKSVDAHRREMRKKRGGGVPRVDGSAAMANVVGDTPSPSFALMIADELEQMLRKLRPELASIAVAKMEGHTNLDIARSQGCSVSTVERRLRLIRRILESEFTT